MDLYRELILDHYKHPRNFGHLEQADVVAEENNISCGDKISMELTFAGKGKQNKKISDIRFFGEGCAISQASASLLTEAVKGKTVSELRDLSLTDIEALLGTTLTPSRVKCAMLSVEVLKQALLKEKAK